MTRCRSSKWPRLSADEPRLSWRSPCCSSRWSLPPLPPPAPEGFSAITVPCPPVVGRRRPRQALEAPVFGFVRDDAVTRYGSLVVDAEYILAARARAQRRHE